MAYLLLVYSKGKKGIARFHLLFHVVQYLFLYMYVNCNCPLISTDCPVKGEGERWKGGGGEAVQAKWAELAKEQRKFMVVT